MVVNRTQNGLITSFLQNIFFCVLQKKETHTDLEWQSKWVNDDIIFIFGWIVGLFSKIMFFIMLSCFYCVLFCFFFVFFLSPSQNNPTAVWLKLIGMHNEKTCFCILKFFCFVFVLFILERKFHQLNNWYVVKEQYNPLNTFISITHSLIFILSKFNMAQP